MVADHRRESPNYTPNYQEMVYALGMGRTNIVIDEKLVRKARKLTRLKTKREIVDAALELLVRSESRKGILRHYGSGIWKGEGCLSGSPSAPAAPAPRPRFH